MTKTLYIHEKNLPSRLRDAFDAGIEYHATKSELEAVGEYAATKVDAIAELQRDAGGWIVDDDGVTHWVAPEVPATVDERIVNELWRIENDAGRGFAVGQDDDDINEIQGIGELILPSPSRDKVAVYRNDNGETIAVGDAHGPWACKIEVTQ